MKKKIILITIVVIALLILLCPIRYGLKDGGTIEYKALTYEVIKWHTINKLTGFYTGTEIKIFGFTVYNNAEIKYD